MNIENQIDGQVETNEEFSPSWGNTAPKGGRTVLNRVLKDGAKVPLFLGQTLVQSLRDVGYNNTTTAICEHIDNAIQWGAKSVRFTSIKLENEETPKSTCWFWTTAMECLHTY